MIRAAAIVNEPRPAHLRIIEELIKAGARVDDVGYPSGSERVDEVFKWLAVGS